MELLKGDGPRTVSRAQCEGPCLLPQIRVNLLHHGSLVFLSGLRPIQELNRINHPRVIVLHCVALFDRLFIAPTDCFVRLQFPLGVTNQALKWEGVWRELGCLARSTSFAVREESGHSLKSALSVCSEVRSRIIGCSYELGSEPLRSLLAAHHVGGLQEFCHLPQQRGLTPPQPGGVATHSLFSSY